MIFSCNSSHSDYLAHSSHSSYQIIPSSSSTSVTEDGTEQPLELFSVDAVDDEVHRRVEGHHQVGNLSQSSDGYRHQLKE